ASNLGHNYIGTEHLLLGLIKENEGIAARVLLNLGVKLEEVREEILEVLGADTRYNAGGGEGGASEERGAGAGRGATPNAGPGDASGGVAPAAGAGGAAKSKTPALNAF